MKDGKSKFDSDSSKAIETLNKLKESVKDVMRRVVGVRMQETDNAGLYNDDDPRTIDTEIRRTKQVKRFVLANDSHSMTLEFYLNGNGPNGMSMQFNAAVNDGNRDHDHISLSIISPYNNRIVYVAEILNIIGHFAERMNSFDVSEYPNGITDEKAVKLFKTAKETINEKFK